MISNTRRKWLLAVLVTAVLLLPVAVSMAQDPNTPPVANDDMTTVFQDTSKVISVLANDTDAEGNIDLATVVVSSPPTSGGTVLNADGSITYTPIAAYLGPDSFEYTVCDTEGECDSAMVTITVIAKADNTAPDAVDDLGLSVDEDTMLTIFVLANDTDAEDNIDPTTVTIFTLPANGDATVNGDGSISYMPASNYNGPDSFTYSVCDTLGLCDVDGATVTIEVLPVNDPPDCSAVYPSVASLWPVNHRMVAVNILGVTDPEDDPITIMITNITSDEPDNGTGDGNTSGDTDGVGTDTAMLRAERAGSGNGRVYTIEFEASDGLLGCDASVMVGVPHDQSGVEPIPDVMPDDSVNTPGDHGCDGPGNACNAPGHDKPDNSSQKSNSNKKDNKPQNNSHSNNGNSGNNGNSNNEHGNSNGKGNGKNK